MKKAEGKHNKGQVRSLPIQISVPDVGGTKEDEAARAPQTQIGEEIKKAGGKGSKDPMRDEYDFSSGVRGKYAERFAEGANVVVLDPDIARLFGTSDAVNRALRGLAELARRQLVPGRK